MAERALSRTGGRTAFVAAPKPVTKPSHRFDNVGIMKSTNVVGALGALAQESRLAVYRLLVKRGPTGYTPGELGEALKIQAPTLSFHLKALTGAGLVAARRDGRFLYYSANFEHMRQLVEFLTENCCSLSGASCDAARAAPPTAKKKRA
jgi:ArsR family transcriptional regulator